MMTPPFEPVPDIPRETLQAAREVYNIDRVYLEIGDHLGEILGCVALAPLDPTLQLGSILTSRLALVTAFQFAERIPDDLAAQATLKRLDWKYALHLPVQHPGFSAASLCRFRQDVFASAAAKGEMNRLLQQVGALGLYARGALKSLQTDDVLVTICTITRLHQVKAAMKAAFSLLVSFDPGWLRVHALPHWYSRYQTDLLGVPASQGVEEMTADISAIEEDIRYLLDAMRQTGKEELSHYPEMHDLSRFTHKISTPGKNHKGCAICASRHFGIQ